MRRAVPRPATRGSAIFAAAWYVLATSGLAPLGFALLAHSARSSSSDPSPPACPAGEACCCAPEAHLRGGCPCGDPAAQSQDPDSDRTSPAASFLQAARCAGWPLQGGLAQAVKVPPHFIESFALVVLGPGLQRAAAPAQSDLSGRATEPPEKVPRSAALALA